MARYDICVVGAGIAGASLAGRLAEDCTVVLVEAEAQPGHHTTGRSVAIYTETLVGALIQPLTSASRDFFHAPPEGFSETPLMRRRDVLQYGRTEQFETLRALQRDLEGTGAGGRWLQTEEILALVPILRPEWAAGGVLDQGSFDMDVDALHQGWLRRLKRLGGVLLTEAPLKGASRADGRWSIQAGGHDIVADVLVNAAGAWGDEVAKIAGVAPIGLEPRRRTISVMPADGYDVNPWPMAHEADNRLYFKPDAGRLLVSGMEQTPSAPCDAYPDDMEVAEALNLFSETVTLPIRRPLRSWAGLRTFAPDEQPVAGYDPDQPGFFWLVGQGGAGIQTSPALSETAAALVRRLPVPAQHAAFGVSAQRLSPKRFR